ncbi:AAA-like domain-containing protein [Nodosilinea sp. LEGE 07298]|uniref:WD40 domain-containing protein n=1 Tax=Nodosilinea sp. LEGE 07298 TaxID=2777970 RepID=UPI001D13700B|nr:AAA-like domain-containing protein [Nodosilinea sp. LEGE 07298]
MARWTYQVGGSLSPDTPVYVIRQADHDLGQALLQGEFCFVFNARQMGKSSLRTRVQQQLERLGHRCVYLDMTQLGSEKISHQQWYRGVMLELLRDLGLLSTIDIKAYWQSWETLPLVQQLQLLIDQILEQLPNTRLFILVDEIDSVLSLDFPVNDFFAFIRACHEQRQNQPAYGRLSWALFGVATPSDLIRDRKRTPFNIGRAIDLQDFHLEEARPLMAGFKDQVPNPDAILKAILDWTGGQPLLTQKLCQLVTQKSQEAQDADLSLPPGTEAAWIDDLVKTHIIDHWEAQDNPEHLRTIRNRLLMDEQRTPRLLGLYQRLLDQGGIPLDGSLDQTELLLSGLVSQRQGKLQVKNRIYQTIFSLGWIQDQLNRLRPYYQDLNAWVTSGFKEDSRLLRGETLQQALVWARQQNLSELDYRYLAASQERDRQEALTRAEAARLQEIEARLAVEQQRSEEQQRSLKQQRLLSGGLGLALLIATGVSIFAWQQYRQSAISEAQAVVRSAQALFASDQSFEALIEAIRGQRQVQKLRNADPELQERADAVLERVVLDIQQQNRLDGHQATVITTDFSPDGQLIATGSVDTTIKLWNRDGSLRASLNTEQGQVRGVKFSPDGQWLASVGDDGTIKIWTLSGALHQTMKTDINGIWDLAFKPMTGSASEVPTLVVAGLSSDQAEIWTIDGQRLKTIDANGQPFGIRTVAYSPEGDRIALGGNDGTVTLWTPEGQRLQTLKGHQEAIHALAYSPDGERLVSGDINKTIKLWNRAGQLLATLDHHTSGIEGLAFSPDGQFFVSGSLDKTLALWSREGLLLNTFEGHQAGIWDVAFSPDGTTIASGGADNTLLLWQAHSPFQRSLKALPSSFFFKSIFSHDGQTLVLTTTGNGLVLVSLQDLSFRLIDAQQTSLSNLALHPTQEQFLSSGETGTLKRWDMAGNLLQTIGSPGDPMLGMAWNPNGEELISSTYSGRIFHWQADGQLLKSWTAHSASIWDVAYSPTGDQFASVGVDGTANLWNRNGQQLHTLNHDLVVWRVAYSPDGALVATGSGDKTAKIWRTHDGSLVTPLTGHDAAVWGVAFSPDNSSIATSSVDETVKLWTLEGELLHTLKGPTPLCGISPLAKAVKSWHPWATTAP